MRFVGVLFTFGGYLLIYAATARGGRFATEPWAGLFADAYTTSPGGAGSVIGSPDVSSSVLGVMTTVGAGADSLGNAVANIGSPVRPRTTGSDFGGGGSF